MQRKLISEVSIVLKFGVVYMSQRMKREEGDIRTFGGHGV